MARKSSDENAAFRWAREWEIRSHEQLLEREERETQEGKQNTANRRQIASRIVAEYRAAIAERGPAIWDQPRSKKPKRQRLSDEELFAIYGKRTAGETK